MTSRLTVVMAVVASVSVGAGSGRSNSGSQASTSQQVYKPGSESGVTFPTLVRQVAPVYTADAKRAAIEGIVELEVVVLPDGTVGDVRIVRSLDKGFGLDEEAVRAAKQWTFKPGTRKGEPVPVMVTLMLEFRLASSAQTSAATPAQPSAEPAPDDEFVKGAVKGDTPGLTKPKVIRMVEPRYTSEAMRSKIQGAVVVDAVVLPDGTVGRARVARSLDKVYGLDKEALSAVSQWTFEPGMLNGQAVPVLVTLTLQFRIH